MSRRSWVRHFLRRVAFASAAMLGMMTPGVTAAGAPSAPTPGQTLLQELRTFATTGRVLHVGAHPDDENTQLIAYLSRGRGYDTAYLSVTRGDGGQNILGPQFDEKLGVARTQELLAARRIDGGRQFFTRAIDFGFTKSPEETLAFWDDQQVLGDVVRVIREFRPDVIITRFPIPPGSGGHGQHTASAILAVQAFKLAGDPSAFPEQMKEGLTPWQPRRIMWNGSGFSRGGGIEKNPSVKVDISGNDPVTGESFASIAGRSRSMHKTQGFGDFSGRGGGGPRPPETFVLLGGDAPPADFMDGVDTSWSRVPGGAEIGRLAQAAVAAFNPSEPAASVPALLEIRRKLAGLGADPVVADKRRELDRVLVGCLGLNVHSSVPAPTVVPGETLDVTTSVTCTSAVPLRWVSVEEHGHRTDIGEGLKAGASLTRSLAYPVAKDTPVTQPYWLRELAAVGIYHVADARLIGRPESPPDLPLTYTFEVDGQTLQVADRLVADGPQPVTVAVTPRVALRFDVGAAIFRPGATMVVNVEVIAQRSHVKGSVSLDAPAGWRVSAPQPFSIDRELASTQAAFQVTAPAEPGVATLGVHANIDGEVWNTDAVTIRYSHIPLQLLQPVAHKKVVSVEVGTRGHTVGYLEGAGDDVPYALKQLGYRVTDLRPEDLTLDRLKQFDAVVIGVRALNTRDLSAQMPALFAYVENGGTVVAQYNWARNLRTNPIAPYPLRLSESRVTNEDAPVTFLRPDHPVLTSPNQISAADFNGWVQERGVYFPTEWDEHFVPILAMSDPGEPPLQGSLLVAPHGRGYFVYTSLAFFRQLPAGVPGAYRLFANLVSLGK
jgi:LmbE family N-acetylglucosaminyl deacetylase